MPFRIKVTLSILLALVAMVVVGPLLLPVPALKDTVAPAGLADADGRFVELGDLDIYLKATEAPTPGAPALVLIHGFGSGTFSWNAVQPELSRFAETVAFDRPGFGLSARPLRGDWARGDNPYTPEAQVALTLELMDRLGIDRAVLVGSSSGGAVAAELALEHPERVAGLVLVDAAIYRTGGAPGWSRPLLYTPQLDRIGPLLMRQLGGDPGRSFLQAAWADPEAIGEATYEAYRLPYRVDDWDRALWEIAKASHEVRFLDRLGEIAVPTLVVSGAADQIVPLEQSETLAAALPDATLEVMDGCGHLPQEECPQAFVTLLREWLQRRELLAGR